MSRRTRLDPVAILPSSFIVDISSRSTPGIRISLPSSRSLDALQFFFDVANEARHRAFGDARATVRILRQLLDRVDERQIVRWEDLETLLSRRAPRRRRSAMPMPAEGV